MQNGSTFHSAQLYQASKNKYSLMPGPNTNAVESPAEGPSHELVGPERNIRQIGDASQRPQILNRTQSSSLLVADDDPWATFVASGPSFRFPPQEHEFNSQHFLEPVSTKHSSQDFTAGYHELLPDSMSSIGFTPVTGTPGDFSEISPSDNPTGVTSTMLVPNPLFSTQIFSEEMQPQFTPSFNLRLLTGPFGETAPPVIGVSADRTAQQINNCPLPSRIFRGRQAILDKMYEFFNQDIGRQHIYVLHGLGGAGKTQIGLKFVNNSSHFTEKFFLDGSTAETIDTGLKNIVSMKMLATHHKMH
ncbi:hypothetical protein B0H13DRAFT_2451881 [Mycena leptocephala]|nr:hypothetical protein B0H13DRAFT_2451881 [Mycena leptocephala]